MICDIGSRDALEGIYLAEHLEAAELHVFEPNPEAASTCLRHLAGVISSEVFFNQVAVTDKPGTVEFYPVNRQLSENKDIGFSSLLRVNPEYTKRRGSIVQDEIVVEATTIDLYFRERKRPDLLWIDVEGVELLVLTGVTETLKNVRLIHVEVSFRPMQTGKPLYWAIEEFLLAKGFAFYGFMEVSALRGFLYRHRLFPNPPWRLNAVFYRRAI